MVRACYLCKRRCDHPNQSLPIISFHKFPSHPLERVRWFDRLGLPINYSNHICLCSKHFSDSDIIEEPNGRRHLRKSALPLPVNGASLNSNQISDDSSNSSSSSTSTASEQPEQVQIPESPKLDSTTSTLTRAVALPNSASGESREFHKENLGTICFFCRKEQCKEDQNVSLHNFPSCDKNQGSLVVCSKHFEILKHDVGALQMAVQAVSGRTHNCNSDAIKINTNANSQTLQNIMKDHEYTIENQSSVLNTASSVEITPNLVSQNMIHRPIPIKTEMCSGSTKIIDAAKPSRIGFFARYASELTPEDFQTPADAKRSLHLVFHTIKKKNTTIKLVQAKNRRLRDQVLSLKELVEELKRENETLTNLISKKKVKTQP